MSHNTEPEAASIRKNKKIPLNEIECINKVKLHSVDLKRRGIKKKHSDFFQHKAIKSCGMFKQLVTEIQQVIKNNGTISSLLPDQSTHIYEIKTQKSIRKEKLMLVFKKKKESYNQLKTSRTLENLKIIRITGETVHYRDK